MDPACIPKGNIHICDIESLHMSWVELPRLKLMPPTRPNPRTQRRAVTARSLLVEASCLDTLQAGLVRQVQAVWHGESLGWAV